MTCSVIESGLFVIVCACLFVAIGLFALGAILLIQDQRGRTP